LIFCGIAQDPLLFPLQAVEDPASLLATGEQAGLDQQAQVARGGRAGDLQQFQDLADAEFLEIHQGRHHPETVAVRKRLE
jgi:hypothetical protein